MHLSAWECLQRFLPYYWHLIHMIHDVTGISSNVGRKNFARYPPLVLPPQTSASVLNDGFQGLLERNPSFSEERTRLFGNLFKNITVLLLFPEYHLNSNTGFICIMIWTQNNLAQRLIYCCIVIYCIRHRHIDSKKEMLNGLVPITSKFLRNPVGTFFIQHQG